MKHGGLTQAVLRDLVPYLPEGYALTGSSSYMLLVPELADRAIKDVDVVVYPLGQPADLVDNKVTDDFYITRLFATQRGLQFGLVHKGTGCWVDIFPRVHAPRFVEVNDNYNQHIRLHNLEEIVYGLCLSTLEKTFYKRSVLSDSIHKLKRLEPYVNMELFDQIVAENINQTSLMVEAFGESINTREIIRFVIANCRAHTPPAYNFEAYPPGRITTPNGLQVENPEVYNEAMRLHAKYLAAYNGSN